MRIEIIVVSHGWAVVGVVIDDGHESDEILLAYAHSIDRWGTTKGIAQLCHEGPRKETKLNSLVPYDAQLRINRAHGMLFFSCNATNWLKALGVS